VEHELRPVPQVSLSALVIDLSEVTFISSSGMTVLLSCHKKAVDLGVPLC
jgi:anti-anti-sigma regulatory factor